MCACCLRLNVNHFSVVNKTSNISYYQSFCHHCREIERQGDLLFWPTWKTALAPCWIWQGLNGSCHAGGRNCCWGGRVWTISPRPRIGEGLTAKKVSKTVSSGISSLLSSATGKILKEGRNSDGRRSSPLLGNLSATVLLLGSCRPWGGKASRCWECNCNLLQQQVHLLLLGH